MSHVAIEKVICPVCAKYHSHGAGILLHKNLKDIPEDRIPTRWGMCEEHERLNEEGYIAFVGCDEAKSTKNENGNIDLTGAYRIGRIVHIRRTTLKELFPNMPEAHVTMPMIFCDEGAIAHLESLQAPEQVH